MLKNIIGLMTMLFSLHAWSTSGADYVNTEFSHVAMLNTKLFFHNEGDPTPRYRKRLYRGLAAFIYFNARNGDCVIRVDNKFYSCVAHANEALTELEWNLTKKEIQALIGKNYFEYDVPNGRVFRHNDIIGVEGYSIKKNPEVHITRTRMEGLLAQYDSTRAGSYYIYEVDYNDMMDYNLFTLMFGTIDHRL